jgi:hypothetical protein
MAMNLGPLIFPNFTDSNGNPLSGGKLYTYQSGTTTPQTTYTDSTGLAANSNPIVLDASGNCALWLDPALSYKFVLKDSNDVTQRTVDGVIGLLAADTVGTASLQNSSVTNAKIADDAVDANKLKDSASVDGDRAVTTNHIRDSGITTAKIADANVTRAKLATGALAALTVATKTTAYTVTSSDDLILADATSAAFTLTLPAAASNSGKRFFFVKTDSSTNGVTIDANASELINGALTWILWVQYEAVMIVSNGSNWYVLS